MDADTRQELVRRLKRAEVEIQNILSAVYMGDYAAALKHTEMLMAFDGGIQAILKFELEEGGADEERPMPCPDCGAERAYVWAGTPGVITNLTDHRPGDIDCLRRQIAQARRERDDAQEYERQILDANRRYVEQNERLTARLTQAEALLRRVRDGYSWATVEGMGDELDAFLSPEHSTGVEALGKE
jgi:hypothetical protein